MKYATPFRQTISGQPQISVILPAFNAEHWIVATLESFAQQTFREFELIVVDDGSTDNTVELANTFVDRLSLSIIPIAASGGPARPRNIGHMHACGELLVYADADDLARPSRLQEVWDAWQAAGRMDCLLFSDFSKISFDGTELRRSMLCDYAHLNRAHCRLIAPGLRVFSGPTAFELLLAGDFSRPCAVALTKRTAEIVGSYDETLSNAQDFDYYLRVAERFPFVWIDKVLAEYREAPGSISNRSAAKRVPNVIRVLRRHRDKTRNASSRKLISLWLSRCYFDLGYDYGSGRQAGRAILAYLQAFHFAPSMLPLRGIIGAIAKYVRIAPPRSAARRSNGES